MTHNANIAILGGGIMGLMSAYILSRHEFSVSLYEPKGFPPNNASWLAGGMLAPFSEIEHMNMQWVEAGKRGIDLWREIKLDCGLNEKGSLLIAHREDRYILERFRSHLPKELQKIIIPQDIESGLNSTFKQGLFLENEAHLEPHKTMTSLCNTLKEASNITLIEEAQVPKNLNSDWIIDCRGMAADDPDLRGVKGEMALVRNPEFKLDRPVRLMHPRYPLYIVPRPNHIFMIGATVIESDDAPHVSVKSGMELMSALYSLHPSFGEAELIEFCAGIRPSYPDNLPRIRQKDNIISANGLFRHGFLLSPIMAEIITAIIKGEKHRYEDLFNGSKKN